MRKIYCDMCGEKIITDYKTTYTDTEQYYDYLKGHFKDKKISKILLLIFKHLDLCHHCQKWFETNISEIIEENKNV